jgi:hypothetical protein
VPPDTRDIPPETDAWSRVRTAHYFLGSSWDAPTAAERRYLAIAEERVGAALDRFNRFYAERVAPFSARVRGEKVELLPDEAPLAKP